MLLTRQVKNALVTLLIMIPFETWALGAPAATIPMVPIGGMPLGIQLLGQVGVGAKLYSFSSWASGTLRPVVLEGGA